MHNLILKDIFHFKRYIWVAPVYPLFVMVMFHNMQGLVLLASTVSIAYIFMGQACLRDDKNESNLMLNSLPLLRRDIVFAKYLSVLVYGLIGVCSYVFIWAILKGVGRQVSPISLVGIIGTLACTVSLCSIYLPLYFKIGYVKSNVVGTFIFMMFFFGPSLAARFLTGTQQGKYLLNWFAGIAQFTWLVPLLLLLLIGVVMLVSSQLSLRFYTRREF